MLAVGANQSVTVREFCVWFSPTAVFTKQACSSDQDRATVAPGARKNAPATCQNLCAEVPGATILAPVPARHQAIPPDRSALRPLFLPLPQPFTTRNCLLTQFSNRPSRRKRAAVRAAKARLSRML